MMRVDEIVEQISDLQRNDLDAWIREALISPQECALCPLRTPRESMPEVIQFIMLAAPNTHFVMLAQSVLFRGAGLDVVWPQLLAMLIIGVALFVFSLSQFRRYLRE